VLPYLSAYFQPKSRHDETLRVGTTGALVGAGSELATGTSAQQRVRTVVEAALQLGAVDDLLEPGATM